MLQQSAGEKQGSSVPPGSPEVKPQCLRNNVLTLTRRRHRTSICLFVSILTRDHGAATAGAVRVRSATSVLYIGISGQSDRGSVSAADSCLIPVNHYAHLCGREGDEHCEVAEWLCY